MKPSKLYGLVLAGGESKRMGFDKSKIAYREKEHRIWLCELLQNHVERVFLSIKNSDPELLKLEQIEDSIEDHGPIIALLSAFKKFPDMSWLVLACDLPLINEEVISQLVQNRNPKKMATSLKSVHKDYAEPLIAIWEKNSYPILMESYQKGLKCPRKILQELDAQIIEIQSDHVLYNANTPDEKKKADKFLHPET